MTYWLGPLSFKAYRNTAENAARHLGVKRTWGYAYRCGKVRVIVFVWAGPIVFRLGLEQDGAMQLLQAAP